MNRVMNANNSSSTFFWGSSWSPGCSSRRRRVSGEWRLLAARGTEGCALRTPLAHKRGQAPPSPWVGGWVGARMLSPCGEARESGWGVGRRGLFALHFYGGIQAGASPPLPVGGRARTLRPCSEARGWVHRASAAVASGTEGCCSAAAHARASAARSASFCFPLRMSPFASPGSSVPLYILCTSSVASGRRSRPRVLRRPVP